MLRPSVATTTALCEESRTLRRITDEKIAAAKAAIDDYKDDGFIRSKSKETAMRNAGTMAQAALSLSQKKILEVAEAKRLIEVRNGTLPDCFKECSMTDGGSDSP